MVIVEIAEAVHPFASTTESVIPKFPAAPYVIVGEANTEFEGEPPAKDQL